MRLLLPDQLHDIDRGRQRRDDDRSSFPGNVAGKIAFRPKRGTRDVQAAVYVVLLDPDVHPIISGYMGIGGEGAVKQDAYRKCNRHSGNSWQSASPGKEGSSGKTSYFR